MTSTLNPQIPPVLAEVSADFLGYTVLALIAIGSLIVGVMKLLRPRQPAIEAEFATKAELNRLEDKITDQLATLDVKRSHQVARLHDDIRSTETSLQAAIHGVDTKIERLIGKLEGN